MHIHCDDPLAVVAIEEIEGGHPLAPVPDLEAIGAAHHTGDTPDQDPVAAAIRIAESAGVPVVYDRGFPGESPALLVRREREGQTTARIYVRPWKNPRVLALLILHELAHELLLRSHLRDAHSHPDVWTLTAILAVPMAVLRRMRSHDPVVVRAWPAWVIAVRLEMAELTATGT